MFDISHFIITLKLFYKQLLIISMLILYMTFQNTVLIFIITTYKKPFKIIIIIQTQ